MYFSYSDSQGSLIALVHDGGSVIQRFAYDPWGARRDPNNWNVKDSRTSFIINRGYTGHEHLDAFGIINMNGRVYDPLTAQFFSPDPVLQAPGDWLNYNRYAYCMNNPFRYTDPSGFSWLSRNWKTILSVGVGIGLGIVTGGAFLIPFEGAVVGGSVGCAASAILGTALNGGSFGDCFLSGTKGAIIGGVSGGAGGAAGIGVGDAIGNVGGFIGGSLPAAGGSAAGGFVGSAANAWDNGASLGDGLIAGLKGAGIGALTAGIISGVINGLKAINTPGSERIVTQDEMNGATGPVMSEEGIEEFASKELNMREGKWKISDISLRSSDDYPFNNSTQYFTNKTGDNIAGFVTAPSFWTGSVSVHFAPGSTMNPIFLKGVMIHEFTHVWDYYRGVYGLFGRKIFTNSTENSAYNAEKAYYMSFKSSSSYIQGLIEDCNIFKGRYVSPHPIPWASPFIR